MEKSLGKEYGSLAQRESFLKDNCEKVETKSYMKPFSPEQLQANKERLADVSIEIENIEDEKKSAVRHFSDALKPRTKERRELLRNIRQKSELVSEVCYKFVNQEARQVGYYNAEGDLIECRAATADELQLRLFPQSTGTSND
ncbi:MAG: hypothetical protein LBF67_07260 [Prevotellaceae bacterium]|jgi:hypothetical protein|nr:hypothetical protein [Prevotellaceae bacterium]